MIERKKLAIIAGAGVCLLAGSLMSSTVKPFGMLFGQSVVDDPNKSITFSGTPECVSARRYSVRSKTQSGMVLYLICDYPDNYICPTADTVMAFGDSDTKFYVSKFADGLDEEENEAVYCFQGIRSITMDVTAGTNCYTYNSETPAVSYSSYVDFLSFPKGQSTKSLSKTGHYMKFKARGALYTTYASSITFNYTCVPDGQMIIDKEVSSISLSGNYKTQFNDTDTISYDGLVVTANYNDGTTADVTALAKFTVGSLDSNKQKTITVKYTEGGVTVSNSYKVTIIETNNLEYIYLVNAGSTSANTNFNYNDDFSTGTIKVFARYNKGSDVIVTSKSTFSQAKMDLLGKQTITVSYTENGITATVSYTITISDYVNGIVVDYKNADTEFDYGEIFNHNGVVVYTTMASGATGTDVTSLCSFKGPTMTSSGTQNVVVSYGDFETTYPITIGEKPEGDDDIVTISHYNETTSGYFARTFEIEISSDGTGVYKTKKVSESDSSYMIFYFKWSPKVGSTTDFELWQNDEKTSECSDLVTGGALNIYNTSDHITNTFTIKDGVLKISLVWPNSGSATSSHSLNLVV